MAKPWYCHDAEHQSLQENPYLRRRAWLGSKHSRGAHWMHVPENTSNFNFLHHTHTNTSVTLGLETIQRAPQF